FPNSPPYGSSYDVLQGLAINAAGSIALAGYTADSSSFSNPNFAVALLKPNGCPDVDFGLGGKVTTDFSTGSLTSDDQAVGVAFDPAGRLVVAGTVFLRNNPGPTGSDFAAVRYLGHDPVIEAGSATFASDLQAAVTALDTGTAAGTPRVVIHVG